MQKNPTWIPVVAAALIDGRGRALMQRRHEGRMHGGLWEFPGGKVEAGESCESALIREIEEELAIRLDPADLMPLSFAAEPSGSIVILLYTCRRWHGEPQCLDADALGWFDPAGLAALAMPPLDVPLATAVCELLEKAN